MKKVFNIIGILLGIYLIYTFLIYVNSSEYRLSSDIYDISIYSKSITCDKLKEYAEKSDTTIVLINFKNTSFFNCDLEFTFINPDKNIKMGRQKSILPGHEIVYKDINDIRAEKVKYFHVIFADEGKVEKIKYLLEQDEYKINFIEKRDKIKISWSFIFTDFNIKFYGTLMMLLFLSIVMYYVHRLKEIGILKLNGWSDRKIISRLFFRMYGQIMLFSLILIIPFGIYIMFVDITKLNLYINLIIVIYMLLILVFAISAIISIIFVNNINQVQVIKNKKNNRIVFYTLMAFKTIIVVILLITINTSIEKINLVKHTIFNINKLSKYNLYSVKTSCTPEKELNEKINKMIDSIDTSHFYLYKGDEIGYNKFNKFISSKKLRSYEEKIAVIISPNMLKYLNVLDENGERVSENRVDETTLLIPLHYKEFENKILEEYNIGDSVAHKYTHEDIIYILDGQVYNSFIHPDMYNYDCIFIFRNVYKDEYYIYGFDFLDEFAAKRLEKGFEDIGINEGSINVIPLKAEYEQRINDLQLALYENISYVFNSFLAFLVCVISLVIIFLELRKKEFGVYKFIGKQPDKTILKFMTMNCVVTIVIAVMINQILVLIIFIEILIYSIYIYMYLKNKAILSLKGE